MSNYRASRDRQLAYLAAMGIDVWQRRRFPMPVMEDAVTESADAATESTQTGEANPPSPRPDEAGDTAMLDWEALEARVKSCTRCPLYQSRTQAVFGVGDRNAQLLVIGEAPGAEEDRRGEPFVGRAGKLLDNMLVALGLSRHTVYITNILKSRPPGNRDPQAEEVEACMPYLRRQIALMQPAVILALGRVAAQNLLASDRPLRQLRAGRHHFGAAETPVIVSYHPAYLLRNPADKAKAWQDLKSLRQFLEPLP